MWWDFEDIKSWYVMKAQRCKFKREIRKALRDNRVDFEWPRKRFIRNEVAWIKICEMYGDIFNDIVKLGKEIDFYGIWEIFIRWRINEWKSPSSEELRDEILSYIGLKKIMFPIYYWDMSCSGGERRKLLFDFPGSLFSIYSKVQVDLEKIYSMLDECVYDMRDDLRYVGSDIWKSKTKNLLGSMFTEVFLKYNSKVEDWERWKDAIVYLIRKYIQCEYNWWRIDCPNRIKAVKKFFIDC